MAVAQPLKIDVEITGTCQTCKYWQDRQCMGWGIISFPETGPIELRLAKDGWGDTPVETPPNFGCNQYEPKETESAKETY